MKSYQYYDKIAHFYDQMYDEPLWKTLRKAVGVYMEETFQDKNFKTVLDVGTGTGYWIEFFINKGYKVSAVEPSEKMLFYAKEKFGNKVDYYNLKIEEFPEQKKFDIINAQGDVLSYVDDLEITIKKLNKLMIKNGFLFATVDSYYYMRRLIKKYGTKEELENFDRSHITTVGSQYGTFKSRCFSIEDIEALEEFGFKILEIRGCGISEDFEKEIRYSKIKVKEAEHIYFSIEKR